MSLLLSHLGEVHSPLGSELSFSTLTCPIPFYCILMFLDCSHTSLGTSLWEPVIGSAGLLSSIYVVWAFWKVSCQAPPGWLWSPFGSIMVIFFIIIGAFLETFYFLSLGLFFSMFTRWFLLSLQDTTFPGAMFSILNAGRTSCSFHHPCFLHVPGNRPILSHRLSVWGEIMYCLGLISTRNILYETFRILSQSTSTIMCMWMS